MFYLFIPPLSLLLLAIIELFTVSIVLPFPKCPVVGIISHVALFDWLLSHSNIHLRFFHDFSWFGTSFHFSPNNILLYGYTYNLFVYTFFYGRASWLLPFFVNHFFFFRESLLKYESIRAQLNGLLPHWLTQDRTLWEWNNLLFLFTPIVSSLSWNLKAQKPSAK